MAGKKGKPKKKKSSGKKAGGSDKPESSEAGVEKPSSASSKKGKKGKKRKTKISLAEKTLLKLEKETEKLRNTALVYEHFVEVADTWLIEKGKLLVALFTAIDTTEDGVVSYDEFKSGLFDLNCPLSAVELHQLCKLIDFENTGDVEYKDLSKGLRFYMKKSLMTDNEVYEESSGDEDELPNYELLRGQSAKDIKKCMCCKIGLWTPVAPDIKYIDLTMLLITFADTMKKHPCHFNQIVHTHMTIYGLTQLVRTEIGIQSTTITIFRDKTRSPESVLDPSFTLEDCGYDGRDWFNPIEHVIYYDYSPEFNQCPLLMCDHYFTDTLKLS